jgi:putative acetyltransferase
VPVDQDGGVSGPDFEVCELRPDQHDAVRSLILAGLEEHWGTIEPALNRDLDDMASTYAAGKVLVACVGRSVVGTGTVIPRDSESAEIVRMSVAPAYRRTGLGRRMTTDLVNTARAWGMTRVVLETSADWADAIQFYLRCGFTITHFETGDFGRDAWFAMDLVQPELSPVPRVFV